METLATQAARSERLLTCCCVFLPSKTKERACVRRFFSLPGLPPCLDLHRQAARAIGPQSHRAMKYRPTLYFHFHWTHHPENGIGSADQLQHGLLLRQSWPRFSWTTSSAVMFLEEYISKRRERCNVSGGKRAMENLKSFARSQRCPSYHVTLPVGCDAFCRGKSRWER